MAAGEVTGATKEELESLRIDYERSPKFYESGIKFETAYCLTRIGKQPADYEGPTRYCKRRVSRLSDGGHADACPFHGGNRLANLDKLAAMKHGLYATCDHIRETMTTEERALHEWVLSWPEVYGIDVGSDPSIAHDFETLAIEVVRDDRAKRWLLQNGEVSSKGVYLPDGTELERDEIPASLIRTAQGQTRLILSLKESLNLTRKQRTTGLDTDDVSAVFAEIFDQA